MLDKFSGITINQNQQPADEGSDFIDPTTGFYQEFVLPSNYRRGSDAGEQRYPAISGFQVCVKLAEGAEPTASLNWSLEHQIFGFPWFVDASGTTVGAETSGDRVWFTVIFDKPIKVDEETHGGRWRINLRGTGIEAMWASIPNPLAIPHDTKARQSDGITPLTVGGQQFSIMFRVLTMTADEGVDFLGNSYRSVVVQDEAGNVSTSDGALTDKFWMSEPQPSKFAVVSLYSDERDAVGDPVVIDSAIVDPVTPNVYFHIYYSNEGEPGTSISDWENKLWTRVPQTFKMTQRKTHVLPEPIVAKYVKVEFTQLQAQYYNPGNFALPVSYKKFPKWVLDYFTLREAVDLTDLASNTVAVSWDALDLAYNYYLDDIHSAPVEPTTLDPEQIDTLANFFKSRDDKSDVVDSTTLNKISLAFRPFMSQPVVRGHYDFLLTNAMQGTATAAYPVEAGGVPSALPNDVSNLRREQIVYEQKYPIMFFYLTCRHAYRELQATFDHDRAYFAGVREIAFTRERYTAAHDTDLYVQPTGDQMAISDNDFVFDQDTDRWVVGEPVIHVPEPAPSPLTYRKTVLGDSPVALYLLDEVSGSVINDATANNHDGSLVATPQLNQPGLISDGGTSIHFTDRGPGVDTDLVSTDTMGDLGSNIVTSSWEFWFKSTTTTTNDILGTANINPPDATFVEFTGNYTDTPTPGATQFQWGDSANHVLAGWITTSIYDGTRHHVVVVVTSPTTFAVYVDNVPVPVTYSALGPLGASANFVRSMVFPCSNWGPPFDFGLDCTLDGVAFYDYRLTPDQIAAHWNAGR